MRYFSWKLQALKAPFKMRWKIHHGEKSEKTLFFAQCEKDGLTAIGEVAGPTAGDDSIYSKAFDTVPQNQLQSDKDIDRAHLPPALAFGLSSAICHWQNKHESLSLAQRFGLESCRRAPTSFSIPILKIDELEKYIKDFDLQRFPSCKVKLSSNMPENYLQRIARFYKGPIRIDGNESFSTAKGVLRFLKDHNKLPLELLEQPLPHTSIDEMRTLKPLCPIPCYADEALHQQEVNEEMTQLYDGINVKLMKAGSYHRAVSQLQQARHLGLKTMIGCMVESSLGISGALQLGSLVDIFDLDGFLLLKKDPFDHVREKKGWVELIE